MVENSEINVMFVGNGREIIGSRRAPRLLISLDITDVTRFLEQIQIYTECIKVTTLIKRISQSPQSFTEHTCEQMDAFRNSAKYSTQVSRPFLGTLVRIP